MKADVRRLLCPTLRTDIERPRLTAQAAETLLALHEHLMAMLPEDEQGDPAVLRADTAARQRRLH